MSPALVTMNIKGDMPSLEEARERVVRRLTEAAANGVRVVKVVHGYGSTGVGGKLKRGLVATFRQLTRSGVIRHFIPGEQWTTAKPEVRAIVDAHPGLGRDLDLGRSNRGITIVVLASSTGRRSSRGGRAAKKGLKASAPGEAGGNVAGDLEALLESDPEQVYDQYSQPHLIRRFKPDK